MFTDLTLNVDDFPYTVAQLQRSSNTKLKSFTVSKVGNTLIFVSHTHGFWVIFETTGDVKIGLASSLTTTVDGLCGYFNGKPNDDKRLPNGQPAVSTVEFGDSWSVATTGKNNSHDLCEPHACPKDVQDIAFNMCNTVKHDTFQACAKTVNIDRFVTQCMETACDCLMATQSVNAKRPTLSVESAVVKECKCTALQNFVAKCLATDESIHMDTWRTVHECRAECPTGLVHRDCYRRKCEPTCDSISTDSDDCPTLPGTCFPGCYCPEGTVRKGLECVPLTACRDCVCDGFGKSQYLTYDRRNFTFDGNCTYLLSRDLQVKDAFTFQVYATMGRCDQPSVKNTKQAKPISSKNKTSTCTQALHILYGPHIVHLQKEPKNLIKVLVDGIEVKNLPLDKDWIQINANPGRDIQIRLPKSHVDVGAAFADMAFTIRVPSIKYGAKMEGLCGDCNGNPSDDLRANPKAKKPAKSDSVRDVIQTWLADEPKLPKEQQCISQDEAENSCIALNPDQDPCFEILDEKTFGRCHLIVEPATYLSACQQDLCKTGPDQLGACKYLANYAAECSRNDICVDWKRGLCRSNNTCPVGMAYQPCGCPKTCDTVIRDSKRLSSYSKNAVADELYCSVPKTEGCFCPPGKVNQNGKCIPQKECQPCDTNGHFAGDKWSPDKCTECTCNVDQQTRCVKRECPKIGNNCEIGYKQTNETSTVECCPIFKCVATNEYFPVPPKCANATVPACKENEVLRNIVGADGCPRLVCKCKPYDQCPPLIIHILKPGQAMITDTTGCCPLHKVVCDKSKCPTKPVKCEQQFYEVKTLDPKTPDQCCSEYECLPPKNACIVEENEGKKVLKSIGDVWFTSNPCLTKRCAYGPNGLAIIVEDLETCPKTTCPLSSELKTDADKCCGVCRQTHCLFDGDVHKIDSEWKSEDNCTAFTCLRLNDTFVVNSMKETCPDVSDCPDNQRYFEGCCQRCKPTVLDQSKFI